MKIKINAIKKCDFCQKLYDGYRIKDNINYPTNQIVMSCEGKYLRLYKNHSYLGCYEIKYCPICGRKINLKK